MQPQMSGGNWIKEAILGEVFIYDLLNQNLILPQTCWGEKVTCIVLKTIFKGAIQVT